MKKILMTCAVAMAVLCAWAEYTDDCITFSSAAAFTLKTNNGKKYWDGTLWTSTDKTNWTEWNGASVTAAQLGGTYNLYVRGNTSNTVITGGSDYYHGSTWRIDSSMGVACTGNIETLRGATGKNPSPTQMADRCYTYMFYDCRALTSTPVLPAMTLAERCYDSMFSSCTSLTSAPALPATMLTKYCYYCMFQYCTALTSAPALPATTLTDYCYDCMFSGCTALTEAPSLPATTLAQYCYSGMFTRCFSLTSAPALPATTLAYSCYYFMFDTCIALTNAPALPATTLADWCYCGMFEGCNSLTEAPALPAMTMKVACYEVMFKECTSLLEAPALPATTLAGNCYDSMFNHCTRLTSVPELPATELADYCYLGMFKYCSSLKVNAETPGKKWKIPATTGATGWGMEMFDYTAGDLEGQPELNKTYYIEGVQEGYTDDCITFTSAASFTLTAGRCWNGTLLTSTDKTNWRAWLGHKIMSERKDDAGDYKLYVRGNTNNTVISGTYKWRLDGAAGIACSGNIETLRGATGSAPSPTPMAKNCYAYMFSGCTSLTDVPVLPATTLADSCYYRMFYGCTSLVANVTAPGKEWKIPVATTTAASWGNEMFTGTKGALQGQPELNTTYYIKSALQDPAITDVTAQQRYPWNGKVDLSYTLKYAGVEELVLSVWAVDQTTGITNVAKNVTGETAYTSGEHHIVWDMAADGLTLVSSNVVFSVSYVEPPPIYCVIDLSGGTSAQSYPVTYLDDVPSGGWSDEYKTSKLVLRKVKAGTFTMGSPTDELGRYDSETQHQVTLTKDYYVGVFPVTQRQWELVMGTRPSYFNNDAYYAPRPVEQVTYNMIRGSSAGAGWPNSSAVDATSFLGILRAKSGLQLDLPTEAQWEYACRAGTTTALNSGKNLTDQHEDAEMDKVGRYCYNCGSSSSQSCDWSAGTGKVGTYAPNAWGLYDMHGNVREWCLDWHGSYSGDATDPKGSSSGSYRVMRGGSWCYSADCCRSAGRSGHYPSYGVYSIGFRLVRTLSNTAVAETAARSEAVAATSGGASGASEPVRIDLRTGTRTAAKTETITYSTERADGAGEGAVAVVSANGQVISEAQGSGTVDWTPPQNSMYTLTHQVMSGGKQVGETLTAAFLVNHFPDIVFTASGSDGAYDGTGHGISVDVTDPAEGAVVTYSRTEEGEYTTSPILFTNVTDGAQSVYFKITATGYNTVSGVETVRITPKALTADMIGAIADRVYTGEAHRPEVAVSDVPPCVITVDDYTVEYADNVNAGVGRAIVTGKGNYTGVAEKTFVIQKANYDMSRVAWDNIGRVTYDGKKHEVKLQGLPSGVVPTYQGNAATAAGSYVASATLSYDTRNYNPPPSIAPYAWGIDAKGITVSAVDTGSVYGEPDAPLTYNASGLVGSDTLSGAPVRAPGVDAGTYPITIGTLGNPNYRITFNPGVYTISPRPVTLTSGSAEKKYDGTPLTNPDIAISGSGWASGEGATYDVTGSQTEVGESTNTFTYALFPGAKAANYAVTKVEGTLRVLPNPKITDVTAQQRYPWNGKVNISYMVESAGTEDLVLSVWAVDQTTGITNIAINVMGETAYTSGEHHIVWDMAADGMTLVSTNVVFVVSYVKPLYCVIDLSGGTSASSYPVAYLPDVPSGGWSDDYKTTRLVLRKIPAGTFTMGSPTGELGRYDNETQHQVTLTKDYYMGVFPVTQRQWELVMGTRPSYFNNDAYYAPRPVEQVTYDMIRGSSAGAGWPKSSAVDATSFLGILRAKSGLEMDLPTEAQWEYACRAGTTTALNSGKNLTRRVQDSEMDKVGRYSCNSGESYSQGSDWSAGTAKVGSYAPNAWGLYDMHGNVYEWCLDWYGSYSGDATDPKGSSSVSDRVLRGGSWCGFAGLCRSAYRYDYYPSLENYDIGFRLVRTLSNTAVAETAARSEAAVATSGGASGESEPVRVDLTPGTRTAAKTETITYSTEWADGAGEGAVAVVSANGQVISEAQGSGTVDWTPPQNGTYTLTHQVMVGGEQFGDVLTTTFNVNHFQTEILDVTAQQRYPWNGKVNISYMVENAGTEDLVLSVWAVDQTTGVTNVAWSVSGDTAYTSGKHHIVWDMSADGMTLVSTNVVFVVSYVKPLYCVIDLSDGASASSYPVTYLDDIPSGGWSDEYKTTKLVLRKIPAGTFTMGSPKGEVGRLDDETQHQVALTKDYYVGVFPVTQRQWELVMGTRPSWFNNDAYYAPRPVEDISYNMIRGSSAGAAWPNSSAVDEGTFLWHLQKKTGLALDLPTEAQWEYACRSGTTTALNSGKNLTSTKQDPEMDKVGRYWYNGGTSYSQSCDWNAGTAKVGTYAPNAWGLYDMHGNVREWCLDWYGSYSGDATDPKGSSSGSYRVVRGGSWFEVAYFCRSARRGFFSPSDGGSSIGFRLVRTLSNTAVAETATRSEAAAATSGGASGASEPVRIDLTPGTRTAAKTETITYSTEWADGAGEGAVAVVSANGQVISAQSGSGTVEWTPPQNGMYTLTHKVMVGIEQIGETLTAVFVVKGFIPEPPIISPASGTILEGSSLSVSMTCASEEATIHYTTDGSEPTMESPVYRRFKVYGKTTVKAIAFFEDGTPSEMAVAEYAKGVCDDPEIEPPDGTVFEHSGQKVSITRYAEDGVVRYTTDGSDPTEDSSAYTGPFTIDETTTIRAKAFGDQYFDSGVVTATLTRVWVKVATPVITAPTSFTGSQQKVEITCATEGATVRYTTNGQDPNSHSPKYTKPFYVTDSTTVKAYATKADYVKSDIAACTIAKVWGIGDTMGKPDHTFETGGDLEFVRVADETATLGESMQSGEIKNSQTSILSTVVVGPGTLTFKWKTSCEHDPEGSFEWDHAEFWVDGKIKGQLDGETEWIEVSQRIEGDGEHTVIWRYVKDDVEEWGEDCLWVSDYVWETDYTETKTTEVPVPYDWLQEKSRDIVDEYDNYEKVAKQKAYNPRYTVEQCYVAGLDPESTTNEFKMAISMEGGFPTVTWDPDLGVLREYKVWGRESLMSGDWQCPTNSTHRFFKVTVEMK